MNILILGASYGSLLSTKLLMAGHNVSLVCLPNEAELINDSGTEGSNCVMKVSIDPFARLSSQVIWML